MSNFHHTTDVLKTTAMFLFNYIFAHQYILYRLKLFFYIQIGFFFILQKIYQMKLFSQRNMNLEIVIVNSVHINFYIKFVLNSKSLNVVSFM